MLINFSSASSTQRLPRKTRNSFPTPQTNPRQEIRHFLIAKLREERENFLNCANRARVNEFSTSKKMDLHHFRFINWRKLKLIKIPPQLDFSFYFHTNSLPLSSPKHGWNYESQSKRKVWRLEVRVILTTVCEWTSVGWVRRLGHLVGVLNDWLNENLKLVDVASVRR